MCLLPRRRFVVGGLAVLAAPAVPLAARVARAQPSPPSNARYEPPDVVLVDHNGARARVREVLDPRRPIVMQFIFTSCSTICPLLGAAFSGLQKRLGPDPNTARLVSISIDPENDTPARMRDFLRKFDAKPNWTFLTGARDDIRRVAKAFEALTEDKMQHAPLTFFSTPTNGGWVRLVGFVSAGALLDQFRRANPKA
jgi:protein SCO1